MDYFMKMLNFLGELTFNEGTEMTKCFMSLEQHVK